MMSENMEKSRIKLYRGVNSFLVVDPDDNSLVDLYLPADVWGYLVKRYDSNRLEVVLRGPHDVPVDLADRVKHRIESEEEFHEHDEHRHDHR